MAERKQFGPPVAFTIRRIAGGARLIGLAWMMVLVIVALARDAMTRPGVGWTLFGLSAAWAIVAGLDQLRPRSGDPWWITAGDAGLAAFALVAPEVSGSTDLFYGGFPGIAVVAAAARQRSVGWLVAGLLSVVTVARFQIADVSQALAQLSALITYGMLAAIVGWAVHVIYRTDEARRRAEEEQTRAEEKSALAAHLHDSVLQTLALVQREAGDATRVASLARGQEQELRGWLYGPANGDFAGLARSLELAAQELELGYGGKVQVVTVGDAPLNGAARAILAAGREGVLNALKHSGSDRVDVYLEVSLQTIKLYVRDRGIGFDRVSIPADRAGVRDSIERRIGAAGGKVEIKSLTGKGTELRLEVPR
ncbi:MAG: sensor histidine kinase [Acidimicrobiia bacterium]